jgi:hypothetical protein
MTTTKIRRAYTDRLDSIPVDWITYTVHDQAVRQFIHTQDSSLYICLGFDHYRIDPRLSTLLALI